MTKRISQPSADVVSTPKMAAIVAEASAPAVVAVPVAGEAAPAVATAPVAMVPGAAVAPVAQDTATTTTTQESVSTTTPDPVTGEAQTTTTTTATQDTVYDDGTDSEATDYTPFIVGGVLLAGGILALALSGGDDEDEDGNTPAPTPTPTNTAPTFTSPETATVAENAAVTTVVYDAAATDAQSNTITYTLSGADAAMFAINGSTGDVTLLASADFEANADYSFTVTATDNGSPAASATRNVTVTVTDVNEAPVFATATATVEVDENVAVSTVVFDANATDLDAGSDVVYSLTGADAGAFTIDADTGEVRFVASPDFEGQDVYDFNVVATDNGNPALTSEQAVTVSVNDLDEGLPSSQVDIDGGSIPASAVQTYDASTGDVVFIETATEGNLSVITGFGQGDGISVDIDEGSYSFTSVGTDLVISLNNNGVATQITLDDVVGIDEFVFDEDSAEDAVGFDFFQQDFVAPPPPEPDPDGEASLDVAGNPGTVDAAGSAFVFSEDAAQPNIVVVSNFTEDDSIEVTGATGATPGSTYSFTSVGTDLVLSFNNNGTANQITIDNVVGLDEFVFDEASAETAIGYDFFSYA